MPKTVTLFLSLGFTGICWGLTTPLTRLAVETGHQPLGLIFWQLVIIIAMSGAYILVTDRSLLSFSRNHISLFLGVTFLGTLFPDYLLYTSAAHLPAGIMAILIAMVPMFSLPFALMLGFEKPSLTRLLGASFGAGAVVLLIGPDTSLPDNTKLIYVFIALGAAALYASEGNFLTWKGSSRLTAVQILFGSSVTGLVLVTPAAIWTGEFVDLTAPWGTAEWALLGTSFFHGISYGGYFALVARAGPVFTSQVAYLVTGSGVLWSMTLLGERYSGWLWTSLALMLVGIMLIRPRKISRAL